MLISVKAELPGRRDPERIKNRSRPMPFPFTPFLVLVLTGYAVFIVALAYGSLRTAKVKSRREP